MSLEQLTVVGLGLLGGSVAQAARQRGVARRVVGASRGQESAARAQETRLVDRATTDLPGACEGADLVVLCTPAFAMADTVRKAAPGLSPRCVVTDVGSVKGALVESLPGLLPPGVSYVGAHPMAGGHETGMAHARADLFEGAVCVVTPGQGALPPAVARVREFWEALGARVVLRDPAEHDSQVAWISHLPHAIAFAYAASLGAGPAGAHELRGRGFRDFTRIAASDPELWADILATNSKALAAPLQAAARRLGEIAQAIEAGDAETLHRFLASAREQLAGDASNAPSGGDNPEIQAATTAVTEE
jgi:prephenate dehydrogenase